MPITRRSAGIDGKCAIPTISARSEFARNTVQPATMIGFKQIEFFDHTGSTSQGRQAGPFSRSLARLLFPILQGPGLPAGNLPERRIWTGSGRSPS